MKFINHVNERIVDGFRIKGPSLLIQVFPLNGINKRVLDQMGVSFYRCLINDEDVIQLTRKKISLSYVKWRTKRNKDTDNFLVMVGDDHKHPTD